eukprot:CAMPEP_0178437528 /NCGR_PEP_ID=MMETSP0689_2-20121128/35053_1 /TAXON_ID=160604 /ORGANISM="Amphidinium massartii, Strain CS-259" /LENGTH=218 /DNA_ID=CAMNT_0020059761 /DNA_START=212 /DNA_END=868 /DNA_ORIENTATION=-
MTVSNGQARWPIRRRFRQVHALHLALLQGLGRSAMKLGLPRPPCRLHWRSLMGGPQDRAFLASRVVQLQRYFDALLRFIPYVDQCEALYEFLCSLDLNSMTYDALLDLQQAIGRGGDNRPPVDEHAIAKLPRRVTSAETLIPDDSTTRSSRLASDSKEGARCVICQEALEDSQDVRVLPCHHEYHFECIAKWLGQSNTCCVCQCVAVPPCVMSEPPEK